MDIKKAIVPLLIVVVSSFAAQAWGFEQLSDQKLTAITAGSADSAAQSETLVNRIPFRFNGNHGEVDGELFVLPTTSISNQSSLQLMDNAQSNLRSLINVNAVNSPVQILLNLNININSTVGRVNQLNHLFARP